MEQLHVYLSLILLLILCSTTEERHVSRSRRSLHHFPPPETLTFRRDAVERPPQFSRAVDEKSEAYSRVRDFGSENLPLRAAVESVPNTIATSRRLPLRDAIERRPAPDDTIEDFDEPLEEDGNQVDEPQIPYQTPPVIQQTPVYQVVQPVPGFGFPLFRPYISPQNYYIETRRTLYSPLQYFRRLVEGGQKGKSLFIPNTPFFKAYADLPEQSPPERKQKTNADNQRRIVCYVEGQAFYRREPLVFTPQDLDPFTCTHVIYAFASIEPHTYRVEPRDEEFDVVQGGYRSITGLKRTNPELKILISVGGESSHRFSHLVNSASRRRDFIRSLVAFLYKHNFDGVDINWQYPGAEELGGKPTDKEHFGYFLEELSEIFKENGFLLVVSAPASRFRIDDGFDVKLLASVADFVNLQAYDFHKEREMLASHHSNLYSHPGETGIDRYFSIDYAVKYWLNKGLPPSKLVLGIPFFGRSFTLQYSNQTTVGAPIQGPGNDGFYTQLPGLLAYFEVCDLISSGSWEKYRDDYGFPYIVKGDQWVGYDDAESIHQKVFYVNRRGLGGVYLWTVDMDDFKGICGDKYPLLSTIKTYLKFYTGDIEASAPEIPSIPTIPKPPATSSCDSSGLYSDPKDCSSYYICRNGEFIHMRCVANMLFDPSNGECGYIDASRCRPGQTIHIPNVFRDSFAVSGKLKDNKPKVVCYVTNWAFYRKGEGKFVPEQLDSNLCTHIVYAFATLEPERLIMKEFDMWADIENNLYERISAVGPPALLSLGGWTDSHGDKYSRLVSDGSSRRKFVVGAISFLRRHGFKGLHLDWNYPVCWQSDCTKGRSTDRPNFTKLVQELKKEFEKENPPLLLAASISGYKEVIDVAYDLPAIGEALDFMSVMTYDYHGYWERRTGHVSPLYQRPNDKYPQYNTNYTLQYLASKGAPRDKLLLGVPFYGQTFTLSSANRNNLDAASNAPGEPGEYTKQPGMLSYYEICNRIKNQNWVVGKDPSMSSGPYAYLKDQWVSYDDVESIKRKAAYIKENGFGGAVAWTVDLDDFSNRCCQGRFPLLTTLNKELGLISQGAANGDCTKPPEPVTPPAPTLTTSFDTGADHSTTTEHHHEFGVTESTTKKTTTSPWWTTTRKPSTTTKKPTTTPWWQQETSTTTRKPVTTTQWWEQSSTTSTTRKPSTATQWWEVSSTTSTTRKPSTTTQWWEQSSTTIPPPAVIQPEVDTAISSKPCDPGTHYPDPMNCNAYYRCILGELRKQYCAGGLHWNKERNICDWPNEAKCKKNKKPPATTSKPHTTTQAWQTQKTTRLTTTRKPTTTTTTEASLQEKCQTGQYYPHEQCNKFYVCVNGILVTQSCAPGLSWNTDKSMCDWDQRVRCLGRIKYSNPFSQALTLATAAAATKEGAPCQEGTFTGYEGDCTQYMHCLWGKYEVFQCAPGLHWNKERQICDWPLNARCSSTDNEVFEIPNEESEIVTSKPPRPTFKPTTRPPSWEPTTTKRPTTTPEPLDLPDQSGYFKIVCYFTNWAWYRRGVGKYVPEDIDPDLCTHIVYGFAVLDYENLIIKAHDSWADFDNKFYERVAAYKKKGLKVSLALGGWNDSQGDKYSRLVNNPAARAKFIKHALEFLEKYDFDGLDLDWEYPKCWQVDCKKGPDSDKAAFAAWVREIKEAFRPKGYLLSAAVSPSKTVIDAGYDVPVLGQYLDWVAVMTYDFHGQWDKQTGHVAPLFLHPEDEVVFFNANFSINYWIQQGVPRRKIIMGMPLYGQSFQLENTKNNGLNAKAPGPGQAGEFTRAAGFLAYYEICDKVKNKGWTVVQDPKRRMGPYAYKGNQWVSYDDKEMIRIKSEFIRRMDLGGGMIWALDLDDFRNRCGEGRHPLLSTIRTVLASPGSGTSQVITEAPEENQEEEEAPQPVAPLQPSSTFKPPARPSTTTTTTTTPAPLVDRNSEYKVVCYFTNWAWYRQGVGKYLPSDIDPDLCTHIVYGFAVLNGDQMIIKPHDSWADFDNKFYEKVTAYKKKGIKVLVAIGGWNDSAGDKYSRLVNNPSSRRRFIEHVVEFIEKNNFDGLDLDWEYPKCWQVDCKKGPESDKEAFADFVRELSEAFQPRGWLLSAAVSPSKRVIDAGYDVPVLSKYLDWIAVMCYDYHGQWDKITGHVAPMYEHPEDVDVTFNTNFTIHYWIEKGADRKKLVMGMPMYGQSFSLADNQQNGLNAATYGGGEAGEETRARGFLAYYEICSYIKNKGWKVVRDSKGRIGPYAYLRDQWVSFDDIDMIRHKSEYIKAMGLGGGMIWALDLDDFKNQCDCEEYPLLRTINRVLRNYKRKAPECVLDKPVRRPPGIENEVGATTINVVTQRLPCEGRLYIADEHNCNQYYLCNQGHLLQQSCPIGLYWNKDHCDWPENTQCHPDSTTTPSPSTTEIYAPPPEDEDSGNEFVIEEEVPLEPDSDIDIIAPVAPLDGTYKVVCYFTNWAWYRQGDGKYLPEDIDARLCTHINYGFAVLDGESLTIKPHDSWADIDNKFYNRVIAYKKKGIKVLVAIGGWNDSQGDKYSRLVNSAQARRKFVSNVVEFIEKWKFDGLDLDWEYPKCWQVDCKKGPDSDKEGFTALVRELSEAFKPKGLLLSSAVSPSKTVIDAGYDVAQLSQYFDWIAVMTYDFHGNWDKQTGHVAPLYYYPGDVYDYFNSNFSIHYWIEQGAPPSKLVMGMPLYGQSFSLADPAERGLNAKTYGPGEAGEFTRAGGFLAFYEICERVKQKSWTVTRDPQGRIGPYAYMGNQWVSYDDIAEIKRKSKFLKDLGLGGGMIWALDLDDFRNRCGCGKHPLLKTLNYELRGLPSDITVDNCT